MNTGFEAIFLGMDGLIYDQFEFDLFFDDKLISLHNSCIEKACHLPVEGRYADGYTQLGPSIALEPPGGIGGLT